MKGSLLMYEIYFEMLKNQDGLDRNGEMGKYVVKLV